MSGRYDPELEDMLRDPELLRLAAMLSSAHTPEPPLDDAFKSGLRRELMQKAWGATERRGSWWRRLAAPPRVAWVGAAALVALIALVVVQTQGTGGNGEVVVGSPQSGGTAVQLQQPILVSFNQPMDHQSTEQAIQIVPATSVEFRWSGDTTLFVQPTSGNLAPNTQYQVTIGPGALTKGGKRLTSPKEFTFVTQPTTPSPGGGPSPTPSGGSVLTGQHRLAVAPGADYSPQWSADSTTLYFVNAAGALQSVPVAGGQPHTLVPDGVSNPALSSGGDRIAYIRAGRLQVLSLSGGQTISVAGGDSATALVWVKNRLFWAGPSGVFATGPGGPGGGVGPVKLASSPDPSGSFVSIAPDGAHAAFRSGGAILLVDVATGATTRLGLAAGSGNFQGWSPDGTRIMHDGVIADMNGQTLARLPAGDPSWSLSGQIIVGTDSSLIEVNSDGSGRQQLATGSAFKQPAWAPDSSTFVFVRGGFLWVAGAPGGSQPQPSAIDQAAAVVAAFMQARLDGNIEKARSFLDDNGKATYAGSGPALIPRGDAGFRRYYILSSEVDPTSPNTVRFVVRLIFGRGGPIERTLSEETLILKRASANDPFLIDRVIVGPVRDLGRGPVVVAVRITPSRVEVTFDSDLRPATIAGVVLQDGQGSPVGGSVSYSDRTVIFSGLQLAAGAPYRLVVLPTVQDVGNRNVISEYDLDLVGPGADTQSQVIIATPSPSPNAGG
ncbi:MAG: hypothetical protein E6I34_00120 [Chloroflexi bacterium]|nr:MAG: hypothetical protein E6I34_00120 [Chloroflexota bacterium]